MEMKKYLKRVSRIYKYIYTYLTSTSVSEFAARLIDTFEF